MKTLLFPRWCRTVGLVLFPIFYLGFLFEVNFDFLSIQHLKEDESFAFTDFNWSNEIQLAGMLLSLFMIAFSKLKIEDEWISHLRLRSLNLSMYINYVLLLIGVFTINSIEFLMFLAYDVYALPILYIVIFNIQLYIIPRFKKGLV